MRRAIALLLLSASAHADLLSEHNEQHAAVQAAIDRLYDAGCLRTQTTRSGRYGMHDSESGDYTISGVTLTVKCTKWPMQVTPAPVFVVHDLTWSRPTTRTDGSALPADQIAGYALEIDGQATDIGNVLTYAATYSTVMIHTYRILTIDSSGQRGPWSSEVKL